MTQVSNLLLNKLIYFVSEITSKERCKPNFDNLLSILITPHNESIVLQ